jgi:DnaJ-class molecular chaperone
MSGEPDPSLRPGDEAPAEAESAGEVQCPDCGGTGQIGARACPTCDGTGRIEHAVGGG